MNKYTDTKANNVYKKDSRCKIATDIKLHAGKRPKIIHYLGGQNPSTPFEDFFNKGKHTKFIRYEFKSDTMLPENYLDEKTFKKFYPHGMDGLIDWLENKGGKEDFLNDMKSLQKEMDSKYGCFVNANFFQRYKEYIRMFPNHSHIFWLDFCSAPKPELLKKVMEIVDAPYSKEVYVTFYMNHRGYDPIVKIISLYGKSLKDRARSLKDYCQAGKMDWRMTRKYTCEVLDIYNNEHSPMAVFKFEKKKSFVVKKTLQEYVDASKRFTNKQLAILWKMPTTKIAGLAAAAKRMKLV